MKLLSNTARILSWLKIVLPVAAVSPAIGLDVPTHDPSPGAVGRIDKVPVLLFAAYRNDIIEIKLSNDVIAWPGPRADIENIDLHLDFLADCNIGVAIHVDRSFNDNVASVILPIIVVITDIIAVATGVERRAAIRQDPDSRADRGRHNHIFIAMLPIIGAGMVKKRHP